VKILIITAKYPPQRCGIGNYTSFLLEHLIKNKREVKIITSGQRKKNNNIHNFITNSNLSDIFNIITFLKKWSPEIIHFQYASLSFKNNLFIVILSYIFFFQKKKILFTWHEFFSRRNYVYYFLFLIIKPNVIVVRNNFKKKLNFIAKIFSPKLIYIPNSVTLNFSRIYSKKILKNKFYPKKYKRLFIFYGFLYPHKNVEIITKIINFNTDFVIISANIDKNNIYHNKVVKYFRKKEFAQNFKIQYLNDTIIANALQLADAIILPFNEETGTWNTTINNAIASKSFTLTTSGVKRKYYKKDNIYYSKFNDIEEMKSALNKYSGKKNKSDIQYNKWDQITKKHIKIYNYLCKS